MAFYIDAGKNGSSGEIAYLLKKCILHCPKKWTEIVFLCIGSDRVTGDCLGPYIGHLLHPHETGHIFVYGTLSCPVHALNLEKNFIAYHKASSTRPCNRHRRFSWTKKSTWAM